MRWKKFIGVFALLAILIVYMLLVMRAAVAILPTAGPIAQFLRELLIEKGVEPRILGRGRGLRCLRCGGGEQRQGERKRGCCAQPM